MGEKENIEIVAKVQPLLSKGARREDDKFELNKDVGMYVCPAGYMAIRKARTGSKHSDYNQIMTYYFDVE